MNSQLAGQPARQPPAQQAGARPAFRGALLRQKKGKPTRAPREPAGEGGSAPRPAPPAGRGARRGAAAAAIPRYLRRRVPRQGRLAGPGASRAA